MAHGWTEERRKRQAQLIQEWQPWRHAQGPVTLAGKVTASQNALKHGGRSEVARQAEREARAFLRASAEHLGLIVAALETQSPMMESVSTT
jgi:hypothetical protein